MSQSPDSVHGEAPPRQGPRFFQGSINREPCTEKRSRIDGRKTNGNFQRVRGRCLQEFRISAIDGYAGNFLSGTKILVVREAEFTLSAAPVKPRHTDTISDLEISYPAAGLDYAAGNFVPQNQGSLNDGRELRPIPVGHVHVRMAGTTGFHLNQNFFAAGSWAIDV